MKDYMKPALELITLKVVEKITDGDILDGETGLESSDF